MSLTMGCTFQYTRQGFFKQDSIRMSYMQRSLVRGRTMGGWKGGREGGRGRGVYQRGMHPLPIIEHISNICSRHNILGKGGRLDLSPPPPPA